MFVPIASQSKPNINQFSIKNFDGRDEAFAEKYGINYSVFSRLKTGKDIDGLLRDTKWNDLAYELEVDFKADKWVIVKRKCTA